MRSFLKSAVVAATIAYANFASVSVAWAIAGVDFPTYNFKECKAAIDSGDFEKALPMISELSKFEPENPEVFNLLGYTQRNLGKLDEAKVSYETALKFNPDYAPALEYQGELFLKLDDKASAEANLAKLKTICPTGCEAHDELQAAIERFKDGNFAWTPHKAQ